VKDGDLNKLKGMRSCKKVSDKPYVDRGEHDAADRLVDEPQSLLLD
jgi:hypothetical protein